MEPVQDWAVLMRVGGYLGESSCHFVSCRRQCNVCIIQRDVTVVEDKYVMLKLANPGGSRGWLLPLWWHCCFCSSRHLLVAR